jgi:ribosomal protein S27AE
LVREPVGQASAIEEHKKRSRMADHKKRWSAPRCLQTNSASTARNLAEENRRWLAHARH